MHDIRIIFRLPLASTVPPLPLLHLPTDLSTGSLVVFTVPLPPPSSSLRSPPLPPDRRLPPRPSLAPDTPRPVRATVPETGPTYFLRQCNFHPPWRRPETPGPLTLPRKVLAREAIMVNNSRRSSDLLQEKTTAVITRLPRLPPSRPARANTPLLILLLNMIQERRRHTPLLGSGQASSTVLTPLLRRITIP